jgi:hypothetical protein
LAAELIYARTGFQNPHGTEQVEPDFAVFVVIQKILPEHLGKIGVRRLERLLRTLQCALRHNPDSLRRIQRQEKSVRQAQ